MQLGATARAVRCPRLNKDFMNQSTQDFSARRCQSFDTENTPRGYDADYECELPPGVWTELVGPKRPRILGRKRSATPNLAVKWRLYLALLIAVMIVGGVALLWRQEQTAERAKTSKAILQPPPAPEPIPTPVPAADLPPDLDWQSYLAAQQQRAPRAALVKLPPPRAQLIRLPEWAHVAGGAPP
jgi:hypothetical protein